MREIHVTAAEEHGGKNNYEHTNPWTLDQDEEKNAKNDDGDENDEPHTGSLSQEPTDQRWPLDPSVHSLLHTDAVLR